MIFEWQEHARTPINLHGARHICANPDKLNRWLEAHTVPPFGSILKHPWTGIQTPPTFISFFYFLCAEAKTYYRREPFLKLIGISIEVS